MLEPVCLVARELCKAHDPQNLTLQQITEMVTKVTVIDHAYFVQYDTPEDNPIWGEFTRWAKQPSAYSPFETLVEVRYAAHLLAKEKWLRFVVCKELCHALDAPSGCHDATQSVIDGLVDKFSLTSHLQVLEEFDPAYRLEILAEVGAVELLCPLAIRKEFVASNGEPNAPERKALSDKYGFPEGYVPVAFKQAHIDWVESILTRS